MIAIEKQVNSIARECVKFNCKVEIVGLWVWLNFHGKKPSQTVRDQLKNMEFRWARKKKLWYYAGVPVSKRNRGQLSIKEIEDLHGVTRLNPGRRKRMKRRY